MNPRNRFLSFAAPVAMILTFAPSGIFEQDDSCLWGEIVDVLSGPMRRKYPLNYQMGATQTQPRTLVTLPPAPPVVGDLESWVAAALDDRRDLAAARTRLEAGRLEEKASRPGYFPEIAVLGTSFARIAEEGLGLEAIDALVIGEAAGGEEAQHDWLQARAEQVFDLRDDFSIDALTAALRERITSGTPDVPTV